MRRELELPLDGYTHVAIDTNLLWELRCQCCRPKWLIEFGEMSRNGFAFSLMDFSLMEFLNQLVSGRVCVHEFHTALQKGLEFLSPELPIFPGPSDLEVLLGLRAASSYDRSFTQAYYKFVWKKLSTTKRLGWLDIPEISRIDGHRMRIHPKAKILSKEFQSERDRWKNFFHSKSKEQVSNLRALASFGNTHGHEIGMKFRAEAVEGMKLNLRGNICSANEKEVAKRLDCACHFLVDRQVEYGKKSSGYDPASKKKHNDAIDFYMLYATLMPAYVVSRDQGIPKVLKRLRRPEMNWFLNPEELTAKWKSGTLAAISW